jgi:hypothetical protein
MRSPITRSVALTLLLAGAALVGPGSSERTGVADAAAALAAPNTYIHGGPRGTTTARRASFHLLGTGGAARIQCKLNRGRWYLCARSGSKSITLRNLRRGSHTFYARAVNRRGQIDRTPARRTWRVR